MMADSEQEGSEFGIPFANGRITHSLGSRCRILSVVKRYEGGESDVLIECTGVFRLKEYQSAKEDKLYPYGKVEMLSWIVNEEVSEEVISEFKRYTDLMETNKMPFSYPAELKLVPMLASLNLEYDQKFKFLLITDEHRRSEVLCNMIKFCRLLAEQEFVRENGIYLS